MSNNVVLVFLLAENDRQFILIKMGICNSHLVSGIRIKKKRYVNVLVYDSWMLILSDSTSFIIKKISMQPLLLLVLYTGKMNSGN